MKRLISMIVCFALSTSISMAAVPKQTFIIGEKAYANEYLETVEGGESLLEILNMLKNDIKGDVLFKISDTLIYDIENGKPVDSNVLPKLIYYDKNGNKHLYDKNDGDIITDGFYIENIN